VDELRWLTFDLFEGRVGEVFEVARTGEEPLPLTLVAATESAVPGGAGPDGATRLQFSLEFHGPEQPELPQATFRMTHADLGDLDLFLVPLGPRDGSSRYEAAFA
jgi:hypothetical protein